MQLKFKSFLIIFSLLIGVGIKSYAQTDYYYYKGEKVPLSIDTKNLTLLTSENFQFPSNIGIEKIEYLSQDAVNRADRLSYIQLKLKDNARQEAIDQLKRNPKIRLVIPNYITSIGKGIGMSDYFYVKLYNTNDYDKLTQFSIGKKVQIIEQNKFMPLWFTLRCTEETGENTLAIANSFFESGLFSSAVPDFLHDDLFCANDNNFNQLWGLNNIQNPNVDINICDAWDITEGNGVNVAVLDQGIELSHNDLQNNISPNSYDTESDSSPSRIFGNHGTHVAGTIAAIKDNNLQVVGVAPQATLISVSNSLASTPNSRIRRADGINWAWQNGAHVINNSWGSAVQYDVIDDALENALTNGRNGLGTIIVFATGNDSGAVAYPANSNPDILAVGSITSSGTRSGFSNFGGELDVVAPGSGILSTITNNETATLNGTSMAAPHVAGIVALILSVNPDLTFQQVNNIIENTSQKIGNYNYNNTAGRPNGIWNNEMGYGLVDAFAAVQQAQQSAATLTGPDLVCNSNSTFNLQGDNTPIWSTSNNLVIISSNNTSITVKALNSNTSGQGHILAEFTNGTSVQKDFWVGKPKAYTRYPDPTICAYVFLQSPYYSLPTSPGASTYNLTSNSPYLYVEETVYPESEIYMMATRPGNYTITLTTSNPCGSSQATIYVTAEDCNGGGFLFKAYPNPANTSLTVESKSITENSKRAFNVSNRYELFNFSNKLVLKGRLKEMTKIDVSTVKKGIYVLKIYVNDNIETHRIVIE